jgi:hypothetical protein
LVLVFHRLFRLPKVSFASIFLVRALILPPALGDFPSLRFSRLRGG